MAIYKSSFNKKPEKKQEQKEKKEKPIKIKQKKRVNPTLVFTIVFSVLFLLCLFPNFIRNFILGVVGLTIYPVCAIGLCFSAMKLTHKKYEVSKRYVVYLSSALGIIWFIFHLILTSKLSLASYGAFLKATYLARTTAGGIIFSLISYPIVKLLTVVGAYIFSAIALAIFVGLIIDHFNVQKSGAKTEKAKFDFKNIEDFETSDEEQIEEPTTKEEQSKKLARRRLGLEKGETTVLSSSMPAFDLNNRQPESRPISKRDYILTPLEPVIPTDNADIFEDNTSNYSMPKRKQKTNFDDAPKDEVIYPQYVDEITSTEKFKPIETSKQNEPEVVNPEPTPTYSSIQTEPIDDEDLLVENEIFEDSLDDYNPVAPTQENDTDAQPETAETFEDFSDLEDLAESVEEDSIQEKSNISASFEEHQETTAVKPIQSKIEEITPNLNAGPYEDHYSNIKLSSTTEREVVRPSAVDISKFNLPGMVKKPVVEQIKIEDVKPKQEIPPYVAPPVDLLNYMDVPAAITEEELQENIERLEQVLEDFKVPAKVNNVQVGPAVTRYELTMPRGISVNKIAQMSDDIAMTLASNGAIRVEAPIPGKNSVGIEVPNTNITPVSLRELIDSNDFRMRGNPLSFVLGKDINGDIIFCNLDKMPHLLVAGSTGSGKSVCLNTMLLSLCYKSGPQDLRLILVDPKMVEFSTYNGLPHLLIPEVITGKDMTINALDWSIKEMERRYALFAKNHVVNINEFNKSEAVKTKKEDKLPFIVVVVDELADLMLEAKREIEDKIAKLAAKARAAGIHLVLATQRPSVDVITGTVKANLPSRVAFALTNFMDSKTVLDGGGAEKLLGKGDMLFKPQDKPEPRRVQGAYVSNAEIQKVVEFIKDNNPPVYDDDAGRAIKSPHQNNSNSSASSGERDMEFDPVLKDALLMFIQTKQASGSMISRRYSVGFNRAGRIMDQMERAGFIGQQEGSKPRQVLITLDEYKQIFGDQN